MYVPLLKKAFIRSDYLNDLINLYDYILSSQNIEGGTITEWANKRFSFKIRDWQLIKPLHKINWICNCVKHKDGYPIKEPKPKELSQIEENQRIIITPEEFKKDCDVMNEIF